jgi:hypothetical protein
VKLRSTGAGGYATAGGRFRPGLGDTQEREAHDRAGEEHDAGGEQRVAEVGPGRDEVHGRQAEEGEAAEVHGPPHALPNPLAQERGDLHGQQHVEADDAPGDRGRVPARRERHQDVGEVELDEGIGHQRRDVAEGHEQR